MQKALSACAVSVLLSSAAPAQTTMDVSKITCEQFGSFKVADPDHIALWLSGYYHGLQRSTIVEIQALKESARQVASFCRNNEKMRVMDAVETLFK
jgi:hypothetical protein